MAPHPALAVGLALGASDPAANIELNLAGATIRDLQVELPVALAAMVAPGAGALRPAGRLVLRSEQLRIGGSAFHGTMEIEWREARLGPGNGLAIGAHVAHLRAAGDSVAIEVANLEGPLRLQAVGSWRSSEGLELTGTAEPRRDPDGALAEFLRGVCADYRDGRCAFRVSASRPMGGAYGALAGR